MHSRCGGNAMRGRSGSQQGHGREPPLRRGGGASRGGNNQEGGTGGPRQGPIWTESDLSETIEEIGVPSRDGSTTISIAVEGCCHGALDILYKRLRKHEKRTGRKIDLLICCGDFESLRSPADFHSIVAPLKFRKMGAFHQYYSGAKVAPILTIFIGGNHEASQALHELYYGGWVAPNIYYLGVAGVVNYRGVRIGGISGIYNSEHHFQSRFEIPPFDQETLRSIYIYRNVDTYRLRCLDTKAQKPLDIMLSHDWPQGIQQHGDTED